MRWFGDTEAGTDLVHMTLGLNGETGEFTDIIKKVHRGSLDINNPSVRLDMGMELADVFIYLLNICAILNIDPQAIYDQKQAINEKRFTEQRAVREQKNRKYLN